MADEVMQRRTAHHEAGHVVIAAVQGLKLRPEGIMVDPSGFGLGCYHKEPDGSDCSFRRIVVATCAGYYAEKRFCEENAQSILDADAWFQGNTDGCEARKLLSQMSVESLSGGSVPLTFLELRKESELLVVKHWELIKAIAGTLLAKNWEPVRPLNSGSRWSNENETTAKYVIGQAVVEIVAQYGIVAVCV